MLNSAPRYRGFPPTLSLSLSWLCYCLPKFPVLHSNFCLEMNDTFHVKLVKLDATSDETERYQISDICCKGEYCFLLCELLNTPKVT
ncbi:hypothetical protein TcWFU_002657 [Taenia crassiceps]|uniref:Uncharacterized protein n=1 Tax=Taenia crassiceps TaxID=6207 RepID=A0ABR4QCP1_9CEST